MILLIQLILICVLVLILIALYLDERYKHKTGVPTGRLTQFWDGAERRRFVRINADVPVRYTLPKTNNNAKAIKTNNMSVGGICISLTEKLSPHDKLSLEIECLPFPSPPIVAKGEVVWIKEDTQEENKDGIRRFTMGIEFKDISPQGKERLFKFIKEAG